MKKIKRAHRSEGSSFQTRTECAPVKQIIMAPNTNSKMNNPCANEDDLFVFGTYRLKHEVLEIAASQAIHLMTQHGIAQPLIDTAVSYNNAPVIASILQKFPHVRVGTKLHKAQTLEHDLEEQMRLYGQRLYRVLLHRFMPHHKYLLLVQAKAKGKIAKIGVSNYTKEQLQSLVDFLKDCEANGAEEEDP